jgi:DNA-binding GntR family transcriptional regulator
VARAHNPFYLKTVKMIPNFIGAERLDLTVRRSRWPARARRIHDEHVAVFEAIRQREPGRRYGTWKPHRGGARFVRAPGDRAPDQS